MHWWIWASIFFGILVGSFTFGYMIFDLISGKWNEEERKRRR